uniref:DX domain-containing protein n=1 Tax=Caenorhabditis japonica TaxID=281687 RepID=A0A8R1IGJ3_CAEJA
MRIKKVLVLFGILVLKASLIQAITKASQVCTGGDPILPIRSCSRQRDCAPNGNVTRFNGWCDFETKFCCETCPKSLVPLTCPDRLTPLYGQERCKNATEGMVYSGESKQAGGMCYKEIRTARELSFGDMTFRTNMDCYTHQQLESRYNFMFCHNLTGNLWVIGRLNVNGDEIIHHWNQCEINDDCGEGSVCVKENLCRYRCYVDPTTKMDYDWIMAQILAMFFIPIIFLATIIFLTVKYLD